MGSFVRTEDAAVQMRNIITEAVTSAGGGNGIVSEHEQRYLRTFICGVAKAMRSSPTASVDADALIDKATHKAMRLWQRFNPEKNGRDSLFLSQREISQICAANADIGTMTLEAYDRIARPGMPPRYQVEAMLKQIKRYHLDLALPMKMERYRSWAPAIVEAVDHYKAATGDIANIKVTDMTVLARDRVLYPMIVMTRGDDGSGVFEMFLAGKSIASGTHDGQKALVIDGSVLATRARL